jgi:uncharacterized membrane protein YfcA
VASTDHEPRASAIIGGGFGVGVLSGLVGVGGGFLIVPALVLLAGVPMLSAVGTSLAVIALNSFSGFARYVAVLKHQGLELDLPILLVIAGVGVIGSLVGHRIGRRLPQAVVRRLFGGFLVLMGVFIASDVARRLLG